MTSQSSPHSEYASSSWKKSAPPEGELVGTSNGNVWNLPREWLEIPLPVVTWNQCRWDEKHLFLEWSRTSGSLTQGARPLLEIKTELEIASVLIQLAVLIHHDLSLVLIISLALFTTFFFFFGVVLAGSPDKPTMVEDSSVDLAAGRLYTHLLLYCLFFSFPFTSILFARHISVSFCHLSCRLSNYLSTFTFLSPANCTALLSFLILWSILLFYTSTFK